MSEYEGVSQQPYEGQAVQFYEAGLRPRLPAKIKRMSRRRAKKWLDRWWKQLLARATVR